MKLRNFILAVSLSVAALWPSSACVDYEDPSLYNLFACTPEMPSIDEKRLDESVQFWAKYLGITPDDGFRHAVSYMWESQFEEENIESNIFLNTLSKQGKTDALQLVRLNWELSDLIERATNSWSYQKTTPADYNALLAKIDALRLTGDLSRRKTFLKMRCLFALKDYDACLRLWDMFASKWEDSPLKQRAYGYVAGIYFRKGQFEKAMDIYFEQGDRGSIRKCVNRILEKSNIAEIYDKDPNAPILNHFLEDYANYFYHSAYDHTWHMYDQKEYPIWSAVNNQRKDVLALAQRVVKEGKAKDLQMWQTFIGFVQFTSGEYDQAYDSFTKAEGMAGTLLKDRLRIYKFISLLSAENRPAGFDEYLAKELEHVFAIRRDGDKQDVKALVSMLLDYEIPTRLNTYLDERNDKALSILANLAIEKYSKIYYYEEEMTSDIARQILSYVENIGQDDALTLALVNECGLNPVQMHEFLGTILMREGKFEEAEAHLAGVHDEHLSGLNIYPYLAKRAIPIKMFCRTTYEELYNGAEITNPVNYKLNFCQKVISLQKDIKDSKNDDRAQYALELAHLLFQASPAGDLWALSSYSWSSAGPYYNELNLMADEYLHEAIASGKDPNVLTLAYFGLAANPVSNRRPGRISDTGILKSNEFEPEEGMESFAEGYRYLINHPNRSNPVYQTCDWLKLYQPGDAVE